MKKIYIDRCTYFQHGIVTIQKVIGRVRTRRNFPVDSVYLWDEVFRLDRVTKQKQLIFQLIYNLQVLLTLKTYRLNPF